MAEEIFQLIQEKKGAKVINAIKTMDKKDLEKPDENGMTLLIWACYQGMTDVALTLIETGHSNPGQIDHSGYTALLWACKNGMAEVALALIKTGHSKPGHIDKDGNTALIFASNLPMKEVALALIKMGHSRPAHINAAGNTALIMACYHKAEEVALKLIEMDKANPEQISQSGSSAFYYAIVHGMNPVAKKLFKKLQKTKEGKLVIELPDRNGEIPLRLAFRGFLTTPSTITQLPKESISVDVILLFIKYYIHPDKKEDRNFKSIVQYICNNTDTPKIQELFGAIQTDKSLENMKIEDYCPAKTVARRIDSVFSFPIGNYDSIDTIEGIPTAASIPEIIVAEPLRERYGYRDADGRLVEINPEPVNPTIYRIPQPLGKSGGISQKKKRKMRKTRKRH